MHRHPAPRHGAMYRSILHTSRAIHTYLSMLAIVLFVFFAATGFMLNHPGWFGIDDTDTRELTVTIPANVIDSRDKLALVEYLRTQGATGAVQPFDWPEDGDPFRVGFKSPRAQCDADITLPSRETALRIESRRLAGMLSRLHTARDAGQVWQLLLDITAALLILVSITGLILWQSLPKRRRWGFIAFVFSIASVAAAYFFCVS